MIVYSLRCANGHVFDEWFASGPDFEVKAKAAEIACPECGETQVGKAIMAPRVGRAGGAPETVAPCATCGETGACPWAGQV